MWLYSQVTYSWGWKKTRETQIRADIESELTTLTDSATTNAQRSRINLLEEMSVQEGALAKPHQGSRHEKTCMPYAPYLSPCLVKFDNFFLPKQLPQNGSLHYHFIWKRQVSIKQHLQASCHWMLCATSERECASLTDINSAKAIQHGTQVSLKSSIVSLRHNDTSGATLWAISHFPIKDHKGLKTSVHGLCRLATVCPGGESDSFSLI